MHRQPFQVECLLETVSILDETFFTIVDEVWEFLRNMVIALGGAHLVEDPHECNRPGVKLRTDGNKPSLNKSHEVVSLAN